MAVVCRISTTDRDSPGDAARSAVFSVAVVGYGVGPLTGIRFTSWKQWPAVTIQVAEISAAEQALA